MNAQTDPHSVDLSILIPVYNEAGNLSALRDDLLPVLEELGRTFEVVFVDDGSSDGSAEMLRALHEADPRLRVVRFARNFGQQMANTAALRHARGRAVIIMDADLQTPASDIPRFLAKLAEGYDIVYGCREGHAGPFYRKLGTRFANRLICLMTGFDIPDSASGFLALDSALVDRVNRYNQQTRYLSGLFAWLAYGRYASIPVGRRARLHGESKYNVRQLVRLVLNFITLFSTRPLRLAFAGAVAAWLLAGLIAAAGAGVAVFGAGEAGQTTFFACLLLAVGGLELACLGVQGLYIGFIYNDVREGPPYVTLDLLDTPPGLAP